MRTKIRTLGLICLFILTCCDKLKNPYTDYSHNPYPVIQITMSGLSCAYNSDIDRWSWEFQFTLTETNGVSAVITELMARVYYDRSWPLGETVYVNRWPLPAEGAFSCNIAVISGENVDRIKVFFEGEDENGNHISGAQNFHLEDFSFYDDKPHHGLCGFSFDVP